MAAWLIGAAETQLGEVYAQHVAATFFDAWCEEAARRLRLRPGQRVLDLATGAGGVARAATRAGARVVGVDASATMLGIARRAAPEARGWVRADAHALPFPDASFDAVACPHGLPFFDAPTEALREMARVLRPGGRMVATAWGPREANPHEAAMADAYAQVAGEPDEFFEALFAMSCVDSFRAPARAAGLAWLDVRSVRSTARFPSAESYWAGMAEGRPVARLVRAMTPARRAHLRHRTLARLETWRAGAGYACPSEVLFLEGRKP